MRLAESVNPELHFYYILAAVCGKQTGRSSAFFPDFLPEDRRARCSGNGDHSAPKPKS